MIYDDPIYTYFQGSWTNSDPCLCQIVINTKGHGWHRRGSLFGVYPIVGANWTVGDCFANLWNVRGQCETTRGLRRVVANQQFFGAIVLSTRWVENDWKMLKVSTSIGCNSSQKFGLSDRPWCPRLLRQIPHETLTPRHVHSLRYIQSKNHLQNRPVVRNQVRSSHGYLSGLDLGNDGRKYDDFETVLTLFRKI